MHIEYKSYKTTKRTYNKQKLKQNKPIKHQMHLYPLRILKMFPVHAFDTHI